MSCEDTADHRVASTPVRVLPSTVTLGRRTPDFTSETVPRALLSAHLTKAWAELVVSVGSVRFVEEAGQWVAVAGPDNPVVIVPGRRHHIEPADGAVFAVQFYDDPPTPAPPTGPVS